MKAYKKKTLAFIKDIFKFRTEGRVFYAVDLTLKAHLSVDRSHTRTAVSKVRVIIHTKENIHDGVVAKGCAKKSAH